MHKQTLKNLLQYHRDTTFEQFCRDIFPDFNAAESRGYLSGKFGQFQNRFISFLAELDEGHLEYFSDAILKRYGSDEPEFCDAVDKAKEKIARSKDPNLTEDDRRTLQLQIECLLVDELYPLRTRLNAEEREMESAILTALIDSLEKLIDMFPEENT